MANFTKLTLAQCLHPNIAGFKPTNRVVSGTVTKDGSGVSRMLLFLTTWGLYLGQTISAANGTYSFSVGLDVPIVILVLGESGERPLAHMATPTPP